MDEEDADIEEGVVKKSVSKARTKAEYAQLFKLLQELELILVDSKVEALLGQLSSLLLPGNGTLIIFSSFLSTVSYLNMHLQKLGVPVYQLTGTMAMSDRFNIVRQARERRGIVIASPVSVAGIDLHAKTGISFDLPTNPLEMERRWEAIGRSYRGGESTMYALWDKSGVLPFEQVSLRKYGFPSL